GRVWPVSIRCPLGWVELSAPAAREQCAANLRDRYLMPARPVRFGHADDDPTFSDQGIESRYIPTELLIARAVLFPVVLHENLVFRVGQVAVCDESSIGSEYAGVHFGLRQAG